MALRRARDEVQQVPEGPGLGRDLKGPDGPVRSDLEGQWAG